jgi:hypothetical protein
MSKWDEYKAKLGDTRPWDLLNPKTEYVDEEASDARMTICNGCPKLIKLTKQCKECGCIMSVKTKLKLASCPLEKW